MLIPDYAPMEDPAIHNCESGKTVVVVAARHGRAGCPYCRAEIEIAGPVPPAESTADRHARSAMWLAVGGLAAGTLNYTFSESASTWGEFQHWMVVTGAAIGVVLLFLELAAVMFAILALVGRTRTRLRASAALTIGVATLSVAAFVLASVPAELRRLRMIVEERQGESAERPRLHVRSWSEVDRVHGNLHYTGGGSYIVVRADLTAEYLRLRTDPTRYAVTPLDFTLEETGNGDTYALAGFLRQGGEPPMERSEYPFPFEETHADPPEVIEVALVFNVRRLPFARRETAYVLRYRGGPYRLPAP